MNIVLETFDRVPFGKNCLVGPNALAVEVSSRVRREYPNFGLMLDLSHFPLQGETSEYALRIARDHLVHAHIGNCVMRNPNHPAYGDNHPRFGCEDGENDIPEAVEFLSELLDIGFLDPEKRPILSFEVSPMEGESAEIVIANAKGFSTPRGRRSDLVPCHVRIRGAAGKRRYRPERSAPRTPSSHPNTQAKTTIR